MRGNLTGARPKFSGFWSQAGAIGKHHCAGNFWASVPEERWPEDRTQIDLVWEEPYGDCRQEIVLIGTGMDQEAITAMLDAALLTPEEYNSSPNRWKKALKGPFPKWKTGLFH